MSTLTVWLKAGHTVEIIRRLLPEFTDATGTAVRLEIVPEHIAHDALLAGHASPDVVTAPYWYLDELIARSILRPIDLAEVGLTSDDFVTTSLDALSRAGQLWAIPHTFTGGILSYRADILDQLGLSAPQTLDDALHNNRMLREHGWDLAVRSNPEFSSLESYSGWAAAKEITLLPPSGRVERNALLDGIGDLVGALTLTGDELTQLDYAALGERIVSGPAAQFFDTSAWAFHFEAPGSPVRGRMGYTTIRGSGPARSPAQFLYAEGLGVTQSCSDPGVARRFIAWRHSERVLREEVREIRRIDVPRIDLRQREWFQSFVNAEGLDACLAAVDESWANAELSHVAFRPDYVDASREVMAMISDTIAGRYPSLAKAFDARAAREPRRG